MSIEIFMITGKVGASVSAGTGFYAPRCATVIRYATFIACCCAVSKNPSGKVFKSSPATNELTVSQMKEFCFRESACRQKEKKRKCDR
jgi:hypothetical protein